MRDYYSTEEAMRVRRERAAMRKAQADDALAERVRHIEYWKKAAEDNHLYKPMRGNWWGPFITQPGLRRLLMPRLRAMLVEREKKYKEQWHAQLRADAKRWEQQRAEKKAAKARAAAPQIDLLDQVNQQGEPLAHH